MAKGKKPIGKIVLIVVAVLVIVGVIGSMGGQSTETDAADAQADQQGVAQQAEQPEAQEPYAITDETLDTSNQLAAYITGTLTNNTDHDVSYIQVEYVLYDASGAQIGTALANTNNLKAGGSWKFEAMGTASPSEVASWERADVTGF